MVIKQRNGRPWEKVTITRATTEPLILTKTDWIELDIDERREKFFINPTAEGVDWQAVINLDFRNPILMPADGEYKSLGNGITNLSVALMPSAKMDEAEFIFKRIPR